MGAILNCENITRNSKWRPCLSMRTLVTVKGCILPIGNTLKCPNASTLGYNFGPFTGLTCIRCTHAYGVRTVHVLHAQYWYREAISRFLSDSVLSAATDFLGFILKSVKGMIVREQIHMCTSAALFPITPHQEPAHFSRIFLQKYKS